MSPSERATSQGGAGGETTSGASGLDDKTIALVRLSALVALDAAPSSYRRMTDMAFGAGATVDDVVATLVAVAPTVGLARLVTATPRLALAAGYDIDSALETLT
jgi:4-carboxymuconolactone decarboxylase